MRPPEMPDEYAGKLMTLLDVVTCLPRSLAELFMTRLLENLEILDNYIPPEHLYRTWDFWYSPNRLVVQEWVQTVLDEWREDHPENLGEPEWPIFKP